MKEERTLANLSNADLQRVHAWEVTGKKSSKGESILIPVGLVDGEVVPRNVGEIWCLCRCTFNDASEHIASAMCRGDSSDGPLGISVWNGERSLRIMVPPAPPFVLEKEGPIVFARHFKRSVQAVFPAKIEVLPRFAVHPTVRTAVIQVNGIVYPRAV